MSDKMRATVDTLRGYNQKLRKECDMTNTFLHSQTAAEEQIALDDESLYQRLCQETYKRLHGLLSVSNFSQNQKSQKFLNAIENQTEGVKIKLMKTHDQLDRAQLDRLKTMVLANILHRLATEKCIFISSKGVLEHDFQKENSLYRSLESNFYKSDMDVKNRTVARIIAEHPYVCGHSVELLT